MDHIPAVVRRLDHELPHFPDGRIDYRGAATAAVMTCFVGAGDQILLLKRSDQVGSYPGLWSALTGYLDEVKPIEDKVRVELSEELGITLDRTAELTVGKPYEFLDEALGRMWIIHPVLLTLAEQPTISLDWEHVDHRWVAPAEIGGMPVCPTSIGAYAPCSRRAPRHARIASQRLRSAPTQQEDRAMRRADDLVRGAPENGPRRPGVPVGAHHDQIGTHLVRRVHDRLARSPEQGTPLGVDAPLLEASGQPSSAMAPSPEIRS